MPSSNGTRMPSWSEARPSAIETSNVSEKSHNGSFFPLEEVCSMVFGLVSIDGAAGERIGLDWLGNYGLQQRTF